MSLASRGMSITSGGSQGLRFVVGFVVINRMGLCYRGGVLSYLAFQFVFAGNKPQFEEYRRKNKFPPAMVKYGPCGSGSIPSISLYALGGYLLG